MSLPNDLKIKKNKSPHLNVAMLVCLLISTLGWLILTFSREYKVTLNYRVECVNLPKGKEQASISDSVFALTIKTRGLNYLSPNFSEEHRILSLSISDLIKNKKKGSQYNFTQKELNDYIGKHYFNGAEFLGVENITTWSLSLD